MGWWVLMKIALDAGHGFDTPGKRSPDGMKEYEFNRVVAHHMKTELETYEGVEVFFTHDDKRDVPLVERTNRANKLGATLFISIHADAFQGVMGTHGGITTFTYSASGIAFNLAQLIQRNLTKTTGLRNRGVKTANFHVLRETKMPSVLIEHGFMDSTTDLPKLKSEEYRKLCAITNATSIAEFYNLKKKTVKATQPSTRFSDVPKTRWSHEAIEAMATLGVVAGFKDGAFRPTDNVSREQMAVLLHRLYLKLKG